MLNKCKYDTNPLLFDEMIIANEFPGDLVFSLLGDKDKALIYYCFSNVLTLHHMLAIKYYLELWRCFVGCFDPFDIHHID